MSASQPLRLSARLLDVSLTGQYVTYMYMLSHRYIGMVPQTNDDDVVVETDDEYMGASLATTQVWARCRRAPLAQQMHATALVCQPRADGSTALCAGAQLAVEQARHRRGDGGPLPRGRIGS